MKTHVDEEDTRGRGAKCFYYLSLLGTEHAWDCVIPSRRVRIRMTIEYEIDVPRSWTQDDIEFQRGESSWCANNAVDELVELVKQLEQRQGQDGPRHGPCCICDVTEFEYVREVS